jgi:hypothetical protein
MAIDKTKKKKFRILDEQIDRAYRTSGWMLRNSEDKYKPDFKVIHEMLEDAKDKVAAIRDRAIADWSTGPASPIQQKAARALGEIMPNTAPEDRLKIVAALSDILLNSNPSRGSVG